MSEHNYDTSEYIKLTNGVRLIKVEEYEKLQVQIKLLQEENLRLKMKMSQMEAENENR